ncbi:methionyl-tRNA formyltransferase [Lachnoclostridium sp. Marseille-P6806]|uniref:methionyl-tRNA formyltransferase n=1 Tax=Lachnoclostridium sp. Marseille-P6806 TaxID=2364793 RepID=UPI001030D6B9|nr:formyltransferase family protein [Lachnoclostridium sp. Marseille-P6806]
MHYGVVVFGVKDTSEHIIEFIHRELCPVELVITIAQEVTARNQVSGFKGLSFLTEKYGIPVFEAKSYFLTDERTQRFIGENTFDLGIVMGWQRLIPPSVLDAFSRGIFGFHGNCGYLPFGRGRSPLNWSIILGDTRFHLNLFRYDEKADSPNVFATELFSLNEHDDIRTAQYKNMICSKRLIRKLIAAYRQGGEIPIRRDSKDFDSWYAKRTPADGKIDFHDRTRHIYDLIRGVTAPFPGAYCFLKKGADAEDAFRITVWEAHPFDEMIDFSDYAPGEIVDVFDGRPVVRTVDGSLLIDRFEGGAEPQAGDLLY